MPARLAVAFFLECAYALFTRTWLRAHFSGVELELWITGWRVASAAVYWLLFRDLLSAAARNREAALAPVPAPAPRSRLWLAAGIVTLMMVPLLFYGGYPENSFYRVVFALTSVVVAVREEVFYRGVIQSLLAKRFGFAVALVASNIIFVLYHYGAQPLHLVGITEIFAIGCVLGLIYRATGTLLAPIALHAAYDAMWSLGPIITPLPDIARIPFHLLGATLVLVGGSADIRTRA